MRLANDNKSKQITPVQCLWGSVSACSVYGVGFMQEGSSVCTSRTAVTRLSLKCMTWMRPDGTVTHSQRGARFLSIFI